MQEPAPSSVASVSPSDRADLVVVGGGILGLATAREMLLRRPGIRLVVLEGESALAIHQSGHNSGVVHAGLYYAPGSLKARLCRRGRSRSRRSARRKGSRSERVGKLVVALDRGRAPRFETLEGRAARTGSTGPETVGPERIRELEPHVGASAGSGRREPGSSTSGPWPLAYADDITAAGGEIETGRR